jgi:Family of unknown function (DUF6600)
MKKTISLKLILISGIVVWVLTGGYLPNNSIAQEASTDLISTSQANTPTDESLPADVDPNSPFAQVVRLVQAGVEQSVILTYISNSAAPFNLNADEIIYLNDLGAPPEIANAMMQRDQQLAQTGVAPSPQPAPSVATTETTAQPAEVTVNYFYNTLAPYGAWVDLEGYGWCWRPTIVIYDTGWQPYCNNGHWVYTDCGWYWISSYSWGWATFHYGRWFHNPRYGWCWWPDTTWAPSWVCWRYSQGYCGWAPLPPHTVYRAGVGLFYNGRQVGAGFNFGLSASAFTFVPTKNFYDPHPWQHRIGIKDVDRFYNHTTVINNVNYDSHHQSIVNTGIPPRDITAVTRRQIYPVTIRYEGGKTASGQRREQFEQGGRTLVVSHPHFVGSPVLSLHRETMSPTEPGQNVFHPAIHGNENTVPPRSGNATPNNNQRQDLNRNSYPNLNHMPPRVPQGQQPDTPHATMPESQEHNNTSTTTSGNYHQTQSHYYNSDNAVMSPRAQENAPPEHDSSPDTSSFDHYSSRTTPSQDYQNPPPNESRSDNQHYNHSEPSSQAVQSRASYHSASPSSQQTGKPGHNRDNDQNGH